MHDLEYEVVPSHSTFGEYCVEAIDYEDEGKVYVAIFSGPSAKERAEEYATLKNAKGAAAGICQLSIPD